MLIRKQIASAFLFVFGLIFPITASAQVVVWTDMDGRKIQRKEAAGGSVQDMLEFTFPRSSSKISYDPFARKLYYLVAPGDGSLLFERAELDGTNVEEIATPSAGNFELNLATRKLHWVDSDDQRRVYHSDLDGTNPQFHNYSTCCVFSVLPLGDALLFGAGLTMQKGVWRADADGSNEQFLRTTGTPFNLAFDPVDKKLYVATDERIHRMNPDGSDPEVVVHLPAWQQLISGPTAVEVDFQNRKLYWADSIAKVIQRSNLDGSNVEDFLTASEAGNSNLNLGGLAIVQPPSIPAASEVGLIAFSLSVILAGTLMAMKRVTRVE